MALDISPIQSSPVHVPEPGQHVVPTGSDAPLREPVIPSDLQQTIRDLERVSAAFNRRLSFSLNEKLDQVVVKVLDADTDKVVREIPPAELQHVYERIREVIGLLFDKEA